MTKEELKSIAEELVEELIFLPEGAELTSAGLLSWVGYDPYDFGLDELLDYHDYLLRAARADHITLDMSKRDDEIGGLPFKVKFAVRHAKREPKCPYCGSRDSARTLYGLPLFNDELREKINSGKVSLGGCVVWTVPDGHGGEIRIVPKRRCNACHEKFAVPPYLVAKDENSAEAYADIVTGMCFTVGGFSQGHTEIAIRKNSKGASVTVSRFPNDGDPAVSRQIPARRWNDLVRRLYSDLRVHEWKKSFVDPEITDGEQWSLEISLTHRRKRTYKGSNAYPPYWTELKRLFRPFLKS